jgi:hypothetical protein
MLPCRCIQFRIALRRKKANPAPCKSFGEHTWGGLTLIGDDASHCVAAAGTVIRESSLVFGVRVSVLRYCILAWLWRVLPKADSASEVAHAL